MASTRVRPALQLIALTADKVNFHYAELHDDHLLRGSSRALYTSNIKTVEMSADWKAYLNDRVVEIECADAKWIKCKLLSNGLKYMLQHDSGYVMPMIHINSPAVCGYFPRMTAAAPAAMPAQTVRPPGIVAASAVQRPSRTVIIKRSRDDDADSAAEAVCNGDEDSAADDGKKERDALRAAVESMMRPKSKSSASKSSASKVSFK